MSKRVSKLNRAEQKISARIEARIVDTSLASQLRCDQRDIESGEINKIEAFRKRIAKAGIKETLAAINDLISDIVTETPKISSVQLYRELASLMPDRISEEKTKRISSAIRSRDPNIAKDAIDVATLMFAGTIINAIDKYLTGNKKYDDEMLHFALEEVYGQLSEDRSRFNFRQRLYEVARLGVQRQIAKQEMVPLRWVRDGKEDRVRDEIDQELSGQRVMTSSNIEKFAARIASAYEIHRADAARYIAVRSDSAIHREDSFRSEGFSNDTTDAEQNVSRYESAYQIARLLPRLTPREEIVIRMRFGIDREMKFGIGRDVYGLKEIGMIFRISLEDVRQIQETALEKLFRLYRREEPDKRGGEVSRFRTRIRKRYPLPDYPIFTDQFLSPKRPPIKNP